MKNRSYATLVDLSLDMDTNFAVAKSWAWGSQIEVKKQNCKIFYFGFLPAKNNYQILNGISRKLFLETFSLI